MNRPTRTISVTTSERKRTVSISAAAYVRLGWAAVNGARQRARPLLYRERRKGEGFLDHGVLVAQAL